MEDARKLMSQIIDRKEVFATPWFNVVAKSVAGGDPAAPYYVLDLDDYVSVVAVTENEEILLVRQYRPVVEGYTLELPSGHVEVGESPEQTMRRELSEETGYEAAEIELLGCLIPDVGRLANRMWCYFAPNVKPCSPGTEIEPGIDLIVCDRRRLIRYLTDGQLDHALNLAVILLAVLKGRLSLTSPAEP